MSVTTIEAAVENGQVCLPHGVDEYVVEHYLRQKDGHWLYTKASGLEELIKLPTLNSRLALSAIYRKAM